LSPNVYAARGKLERFKIGATTNCLYIKRNSWWLLNAKEFLIETCLPKEAKRNEAERRGSGQTGIFDQIRELYNKEQS